MKETNTPFAAIAPLGLILLALVGCVSNAPRDRAQDQTIEQAIEQTKETVSQQELQQQRKPDSTTESEIEVLDQPSIEPTETEVTDVSVRQDEDEPARSQSLDNDDVADQVHPETNVGHDPELATDVVEPVEKPVPESVEFTEAVAELCRRIGNKLGSVAPQDCYQQPFKHGGFSTGGLSLAYRDFTPVEGRITLGKVLVLGGIHGDEFSSVSVLFKWLKILDQHHSGLFQWRFVPVANPDGLLRRNSQRQNENGVDLNRNFPTSDWNESAQRYWIDETYRNPRRYPGPHAASEVETQWIIDQIQQFEPDVIIAMHAPYHLVDYDGPPEAPENLGSLYLRKLGVYPGSLGNYVGVDMGKRIVTVELKSAGIMPSNGEIELMWTDLVQWLRKQLQN